MQCKVELCKRVGYNLGVWIFDRSCYDLRTLASVICFIVQAALQTENLASLFIVAFYLIFVLIAKVTTLLRGPKEEKIDTIAFCTFLS